MSEQWSAFIGSLTGLHVAVQREYRGPLSAAKCAEGINAARVNARRLCRAARLLLTAAQDAAATQLCIIAVEEAGKEKWLRDLLVAETDEEVKAIWKACRNHRMKNTRLFGPLLADAEHPFAI